MRAIAIGVAIAAVLFLVSAGHLIFIPLLFIPLGFFTLRRGRNYLASVRGRPLVRRRVL